MVKIAEVVVEEPSPPPSQERQRDAEEIEKLLSQLQHRPTAKMQLESFVKKLKKEAAALKAIEESTAPATTEASTAPAATTTEKETIQPEATSPTPLLVAANSALASKPSVTYTSIDKFAFDAGGSTDKFVTLYLPLPGVGSKTKQKEDVNCSFEKTMFDVKVLDLQGKNYRLIRNNLEHTINPEKSKYIIKADKIIVKLAKVQGSYGSYDYWSKLTDTKKGEKKNSTNSNSSAADPSASIMNMMKDMYESGDDKMKKMIGETMLKQRNGELNNKDSMNGGLGDLGDMGM